MTDNNDPVDWLNTIAEKYDPNFTAESPRQVTNSLIGHIGGESTDASATERSASAGVLVILLILMVVLMGIVAVLLFTTVQ